MALSDRRRKVLFILALAVLIAWGVAVAVLGPDAGGTDTSGGSAGRGGLKAASGRPAAAPSAVAAGPALRFLSAYLGYERGTRGQGNRRALARLSTPTFARQLLRAPVRIPVGRAPSPEWVSRVAGVRVGIFEGRQALLVGVVIVGTGGSHVLTPTLVRAGSGWLVAGIGE